MGLRFRKSAKITKGVRINVGTKGFSLGFGKKGIHRTINSNGKITDSFKILNTGLAYQVSSKKFSTSIPNNSSNKHELVYHYESFLSNLKTLHLASDPYIDWKELANKEAPFELDTLNLAYINAVNNLNSYNPNFLEKIFSNLKAKKLDDLQAVVNIAEKEALEEYDKWKKLKKLAEDILTGDLEAYLRVIDSMKPLDDLLGYGSHFKYKVVNTENVEVEFKINIDDIVPKKSVSLTPTGRLSNKKLSKTAYYDLCQDYICSCVIRIAEDMFSLLPLEFVLINVIDERLDSTTGYSKNVDILSVEINKKILASLNKKEIDPSDAMVNFRCSMEFLKTRGFKEIKRLS